MSDKLELRTVDLEKALEYPLSSIFTGSRFIETCRHVNYCLRVNGGMPRKCAKCNWDYQTALDEAVKELGE